jgi:hypothetical protein
VLLRSLFCHELKGLYLVRRKHCNSSGRIITTIFLKYDNSRVIVATFFRGDGLVEQGLRFKLVRTTLNLRSPNLCEHVEATITISLHHYVGM